MPRNRFKPRNRSKKGDNKGESIFRPEVQGLRFLAVSLVIVYHFWGNGRVSGGVDVLLFISIFFITGHFVRAFYNDKKVSVFSQILKTFKRLLPSAVVTIGAIFLASYLILPKNHGKSLTEQGWASLLYWQNWLLAFNSVDYYAPNHATASPFQHFWSLSVQGQVFILWPILLGLCAYICKKFELSYRTMLCLLFASIFIVSLRFSITSTAANPTFAYFDTRARLWEFALGSLVAIIAPLMRLPEKLKKFIPGASVIAFVLYGLIAGRTSEFSGYGALWPLLAATLFMTASQGSSSSKIGNLLGSKPMVRLGNLSYGLYLWHWPILILYLNRTEKNSINIIEALGILILTFVIASINHHYIERPTQLFSFENPTSLPATRQKIVAQQSAVLVICLALFLGAIPFKLWDIPYKERQTESIHLAQTGLGDYPYLGAKVLNESSSISSAIPGSSILPLSENARQENDGKLQLNVIDERFLPYPENFDNQWAELPESCQGLFAPSALDADQKVLDKTCSALTTNKEASRLIVAIGDSHTQQWLEPLIPLAQKNNWQLIAFLKGGCSYTDYGVSLRTLYQSDTTTPENQKTPKQKQNIECEEHYKIIENYVNELAPDLIYTMGTKALTEAPGEDLIVGFNEMVQSWKEKSVPVMGVRDNPRFNFDIAECALTSADPNDCAVPRDFRVAAISALEEFGPEDNIIPIDLTDFLCNEDYCYAAAGNVLMYLDDNHLTKDYASSMTPFFEKRFFNATRWHLNPPSVKSIYHS